MDFKEATDQLFDRVDHESLAKSLGVSVALIRQSRLGSSAKAFRASPHGWEKAVAQIAAERLKHYQRLIDCLRPSISRTETADDAHVGGPRKRSRPVLAGGR